MRKEDTPFKETEQSVFLAKSNYSLLSGAAAASSPESLVKAFKQKKYMSASLIEYRNFYGMSRHFEACRAHDMNPIFGVTLPVDAGFGHQPIDVSIIPQDSNALRSLFTTSNKVNRDGNLLTKDDVAELAQSSFIVITGEYHQFRDLLHESETVFSGLHSPNYSSQKKAISTEKNTGKVLLLHDVRMANTSESSVQIFASEQLSHIRNTIPRKDVLNHSIKSPIEIESLYSGKDLRSVRGRTKEVAQSIQLEIPKNIPFKAKSVPNEMDSSEYLQEKVEDARHRRDASDDELRARVTEEMSFITLNNFDDYVLVCLEIAEYAQRRGIEYTTYGSGNNSVVLELLGITKVHASDLDFRRFMNPQRVDLPDVDFDLPYDRKEEIEKLLLDRYEDAAMLTVVQRLKADGLEEIVTKKGVQISEETKNTVLKAELPREITKHPTGITWFADAPLYRKNNDLIQLDKVDVEKILHLPKIDLLSKVGLTRISRIKEQLEKNGLPTEVIDGDPATLNKIFSGNTLGISNIESPHLQNILRIHGGLGREHTIREVAQILAVARPRGEARSRFYENPDKRKKFFEAFPEIGKIIGPTNFTLTFQEQLMHAVTELAGMPQTEAEVYKKMSAERTDPEEYQRLVNNFYSALLQKGYPEKISYELADQLFAYQSYMFVEGHARALADVTYKLAYYAEHYPTYFWGSVFSTLAEKPDSLAYPQTLQAYINEAMRNNVSFQLPSEEDITDLPRLEGDTIVIGKYLIPKFSMDRYKKTLTCINNSDSTVSEKVDSQLENFGYSFTHNPITKFPHKYYYKPDEDSQWIIGHKEGVKVFRDRRNSQNSMDFIVFESGERLHLTLSHFAKKRKPEAYKGDFWYVRVVRDERRFNRLEILDARPLSEAV